MTFDESKKYLIIGARKSGSTSLEVYMKNQGLDVIRHEQLFTRHDGPEYAQKVYPGRVPVVILRNPMERIISDYSYQPNGGKSNRELDFIDYCALPNYDKKWGDRNPVSQSNYKYWLQFWKPIVLNIHVMKKLKGFPFQNRTENKSSITKKEYDFAQNLLRTARSRT